MSFTTVALGYNTNKRHRRTRNERHSFDVKHSSVHGGAFSATL